MKNKLTAKQHATHNTIVTVGKIKIGGLTPTIIAGPCSVESEEQLLKTAVGVAEAGAHLLRGGAFKPRTSPYSFQGLGEDGLKLLVKAREKTGLTIVTEIVSEKYIPLFEKYEVDVYQVGARNCQNYDLLKALGKVKKPVLLKRGMGTKLEEFLLSAEYLVHHGNPNVIMCERGITTFENYTRNTLDLNTVAALKQLTHLPIIVDPSHGTGIRSLVTPLARASIAAGADGLIIEVHQKPEEALCDGQQSLNLAEFSELVDQVNKISHAVKK
ncbi:MAG: 3-deoxy-7-phosphoheptulonate synthase [Candidatus Micrarchaeota archaeon]|nr:3-deoxy-7-phosphoheptulonate synthase [Candidatus Micrarchaeota archaeon]